MKPDAATTTEVRASDETDGTTSPAPVALPSAPSEPASSPDPAPSEAATAVALVRAGAAELATVGAQAARSGVNVDVAEAVQKGTRQGRSMRSFGLPWIPHDDVILASDIQGVPAFGGSENDQLATVMMRKLTLMRRKHAQTREYMEMNALRGIVKDGAGTTLYNYFTEFGLRKFQSIFFSAPPPPSCRPRSAMRSGRWKTISWASR